MIKPLFSRIGGPGTGLERAGLGAVFRSAGESAVVASRSVAPVPLAPLCLSRSRRLRI